MVSNSKKSGYKLVNRIGGDEVCDATTAKYYSVAGYIIFQLMIEKMEA
jgi:hypothetical protein